MYYLKPYNLKKTLKRKSNTKLGEKKQQTDPITQACIYYIILWSLVVLFIVLRKMYIN
jgi:hypothetical protein